MSTVRESDILKVSRVVFCNFLCFKFYVFYLFHSFDLVALWSLGLSKEVIVISVLHEASELLVNSGLLGVGHGKVLILANHPVSQTRILHSLVLGVLHTLALLEGHVELLIGDEELRADILARVNDLFRMGAYTRSCMSRWKRE